MSRPYSCKKTGAMPALPSREEVNQTVMSCYNAVNCSIVNIVDSLS